MPETKPLSEAERALLAKYVRREHIEHLAHVLREHSDRTRGETQSSLLSLNAEGSNPPFFMLHGDYLVHPPLWCSNMALDLGADQPLHVLEPSKLEGRVAPTLEAMAAAHLEEVRAVQPEGPYSLGGWCNGALVAFEMAQQLQATGQHVDLLVLIEPYRFTRHHQMAHHLLQRLGGWTRHHQDWQLDWFIRQEKAYRQAYADLQLTKHWVRTAPGKGLPDLARSGRAALRIALARTKALLHGYGAGGDTPRPREDYPFIFDWMAMAYVVRSYRGQITLFRSCEARAEAPSNRVGWCRVASDVDVHILAGTYQTCRTDQVHDMGAHLRMCLQQAQAVVSTPPWEPTSKSRTKEHSLTTSENAC